MTTEQTLTVEEMAKALDVTDGRIRQLARAGILQGKKRAGSWFFDPAEVGWFQIEYQGKRRKRKKKQIE